MTDESPTLEILWQYALRFRVEELFLDSKSGAFQLEDSKVRSAQALERLYLGLAEKSSKGLLCLVFKQDQVC